MKKLSVLLILGLMVLSAHSQFSKASMQVGGLTCSMCSKAVKVALEKIDFVSDVKVNLKNQEYEISFRPQSALEFDKLKEEVVGAGFSVLSLKVKGIVHSLNVEKDKHVSVGGKSFHFLNGDHRKIDGEVAFTIVDRGFLTAKEFKKISATTKMSCLQTGQAADCCEKAGISGNTRIYHVII